MKCEVCGGHNFEESFEPSDPTCLSTHVRAYRPKDRSPPNKLINAIGGAENSLFSNGGAMS